MQETATKTFEKIAANAEKSAPTVRRVRTIAVGKAVRQGDVYVVRIGAKGTDPVDALAKLRARAAKGEDVLAALPSTLGEVTKIRQVAVGETTGSRHVAEGELTVYERPENAHALIGPVVVAPKRWVLTHPEHGHFSLPAGAYVVLYQRDWARERADEIRRVAD